MNHPFAAQVALATAYDGRDARSLTTKVAYKFKSGTHRHSIHVLFMKCRLRPVTDFGAEGTFTYQELILGLATLNLTFDVYEARALFATLGGGPGRVVHVKTLDTLLMAFWLRVTQTKRRNETEKRLKREAEAEKTDPRPKRHMDFVWSKAGVEKTIDPGPLGATYGNVTGPLDELAKSAAALYLDQEEAKLAAMARPSHALTKLKASARRTSLFRRLNMGEARNKETKKQPEHEIQGQQDVAALLQAEHLLHRQRRLATRYTDLRRKYINEKPYLLKV